MAKFYTAWNEYKIDNAMCIDSENTPKMTALNPTVMPSITIPIFFSSRKSNDLSNIRQSPKTSQETEDEIDLGKFFLYNLSFMPTSVATARALSYQADLNKIEQPDRERIQKESQEKYTREKRKFDALLTEMREAQSSISSETVRTVLRDFETSLTQAMDTAEQVPMHATPQ
jgi:hypothetical protein